MKKISIVIPVYYNELNLSETVPQLLNIFEKLQAYQLELVFVDDGSGDHSLDLLRDYQKQEPNIIKIIKLTRNFGSMAAIQAGLTVASGDCIGMISADLQDPPELFLDMIQLWEQGNKTILAVRQDREDSAIQKMFSNTYYYLIRKIAIPNYPMGGFDFFLIDRQVANQVNQILEKNTNIMSLIFWLGFKPILIPYIRRTRKIGQSRWTLKKKIKLFEDTFISFSSLPFKLIMLLGYISMLSGLVYGGYHLFTRSLTLESNPEAYVIIFLILFFSGIQMVLSGVLGKYLWQTLEESRKRPLFVIDEIITSPNNMKPND